jgi:hypothetical protein
VYKVVETATLKKPIAKHSFAVRFEAAVELLEFCVMFYKPIVFEFAYNCCAKVFFFAIVVFTVVLAHDIVEFTIAHSLLN